VRHASAGSIELEQDTEQSHAVLEQCKDDRGADQDSAVFTESSTSGFVCFYGNESVVSVDATDREPAHGPGKHQGQAPAQMCPGVGSGDAAQCRMETTVAPSLA
jgi:hypothetical protein